MWNSAAGKVRFGEEAMEWFAAKIGLDPDDERLPDIAIKLASAGKLEVMVSGNTGALVAIAKSAPTSDLQT
jgi:hypothetical protein